MSKFKEFKQKVKRTVKENKEKIVAGVLFIGGVAFVISKQNDAIKELEQSTAKQTEDITKLKNAMVDTVLPYMLDETMKEIRNTVEDVMGENLDDMSDEEVEKIARNLIK